MLRRRPAAGLFLEAVEAAASRRVEPGHPEYAVALDSLYGPAGSRISGRPWRRLPALARRPNCRLHAEGDAGVLITNCPGPRVVLELLPEGEPTGTAREAVSMLERAAAGWQAPALAATGLQHLSSTAGADFHHSWPRSTRSFRESLH
ncbi:MAG: hypothetical protein U0835_01550 [Isosphaeraceae bacterium]